MYKCLEGDGFGGYSGIYWYHPTKRVGIPMYRRRSGATPGFIQICCLEESYGVPIFLQDTSNQMRQECGNTA